MYVENELLSKCDWKNNQVEFELKNEHDPVANNVWPLLTLRKKQH